MTSFVNNIIKQTIESTPLIQPRVRGKFEQDTNSTPVFFHDDSPDSFQQDEILPEQADDLSRIKEKITGDSPELIRRSNESFHTGTSENSFKTSRPQSSLINQLVSKVHDDKQKELKLSSGNLMITPQPVSEKIFEDNKATEKLTDTVADGTSNRMNKDTVKQTKEIHAHKTDEDKKTIKRNIQEKELPASEIQPLILPVKEQFSMPAIRKAGADFNSLQGNTLLNDNSKKREIVFPDEFSQAKEKKQTINISIGRVEVRVSQPAVQVMQVPKKEGIPIMSLDEYLDKKKPGSK